jgi:hypothetical protein
MFKCMELRIWTQFNIFMPPFQWDVWTKSHCQVWLTLLSSGYLVPVFMNSLYCWWSLACARSPPLLLPGSNVSPCWVGQLMLRHFWVPLRRDEGFVSCFLMPHLYNLPPRSPQAGTLPSAIAILPGSLKMGHLLIYTWCYWNVVWSPKRKDTVFTVAKKWNQPKYSSTDGWIFINVLHMHISLTP